MKKIVIFASGAGSNAENIILFLKDNQDIKVELILTNVINAGVIEKGHKLDVPVVIFNKKMFSDPKSITQMLLDLNIDWVILAGFLWLIPDFFIKAFPDKIINIHPSLLPKYGGKGMWGHHVHNSVIINKESESGITIHYVNEEYDKGKVILQAKCEILETDSAEELAKKIHKLEYDYFPKTVLTEIMKNQTI